MSKNKKIFTTIAIAVLVVGVLSTSALAYTGFVPGLTPLMQTNKPVDLGVQYTNADYENFQKKTLSSVSNFDGESASTPGSQLVIYGANSIQTAVTQEELTAFINTLPWSKNPLSNSQVRVSDGFVEYSGNVSSEYINDLVNTLYPSDDSIKLSPILKLAAYLQDPAVYAKFKVSVQNTTNGPSRGLLRFTIVGLKVNRMDLSGQVSNMNELTARIGSGSSEQGIPYSVSSLNAKNGTLDFYGNFPANFSVGNGDPTTICSHYHGGSIVSLGSVNGRIGSDIKYCY